MGHIFALPWDSLIHIYEQLLKSVVFLKRNLQTREAAATAFGEAVTKLGGVSFVPHPV